MPLSQVPRPLLEAWFIDLSERSREALARLDAWLANLDALARSHHPRRTPGRIRPAVREPQKETVQ